MIPMIEREVSIPSGGITLAGTLCYPQGAGPFPTALWLQGSGPLDRDDNVPGQELNNSKLIAHHLVKCGIASLRFDKRGVGKSGGDYLSAGHRDLVEDGLNCLLYLANSELCDSAKLFAIGHSEGSIIAPQLSLLYEPIAGIVLLCPCIEDPESLLLRQAHELKKMAGRLTGIKSLLAKLFLTIFDPVRQHPKYIRKIKESNKKVGRLGLSKQPFHWFKQFLSLDLQQIYSQTKCPTLAIGGSKDFQCRPSDVHAIKALVQGEYESHAVQDMTHIIRNEPKQASVFNYAKQFRQPIEPDVLTLMQAWLEKHINKPGA
jgi:hypothetical protein